MEGKILKTSSNKQRIIYTGIIWVVGAFISMAFLAKLGLGEFAMFICVCLTILVWVLRSDKKPKEKRVPRVAKEVDVRDKPYAMTTLRYLGGGTINNEKNVPIVVTIRGLKYGTEFIPIESITATAIETQSQILSRISATRMLAFGVFSLAMPKRKQKTQKFLTVDYDHGFQSTLIFEGKTIVKVNSALIKAKQMSKYY